MTVHWPEPSLPPINLHVLLPAYQFYSKRKPAMKFRLTANFVGGSSVCCGCSKRLTVGKRVFVLSSNYWKPTTFLCEPCVIDMAEQIKETTDD